MRQLFPGLPQQALHNWFKASFWGMLGLVIFATLFGLILVHTHVTHLSAEMSLIASHHMLPVIMPNDSYIQSPIHQLGSALFFGFTMGLFFAIIASIASIPIWIKQRIDGFDALFYVILVFLSLSFSFSKEMPFISFFFSLFFPAAFFVPWFLVRKCKQDETHQCVNIVQWIVFVTLLTLPFCSFRGISFIDIRDSMIGSPVLDKLCDFYYNHTLLAAQVIKPISAYTQKTILIPEDATVISPPHGSLWLKAKQPCGINGATLIASKEKLSCPSIIIQNSDTIINSRSLIHEGSKKFDGNKRLRNSIGLFLKGGLLFIPLFFIVWMGFYLCSLFDRHKVFAVLFLLIYFSLFIPHLHSLYLIHITKNDYTMAQTFAFSESPKKRYIAIKYGNAFFSTEKLLAFLDDPSPRVRMRAYMALEQKSGLAFTDKLEQGMRDPQLIVRTKACSVLGKIGDKQSLEILSQVAQKDLSWYVRTYAYSAIGNTNPIYKIVD